MAGMYGVSAYQQTNKSWEAKNIKPVAGHASDNSQKVSAKNDILQISKEGYAGSIWFCDTAGDLQVDPRHIHADYRQPGDLSSNV